MAERLHGSAIDTTKARLLGEEDIEEMAVLAAEQAKKKTKIDNQKEGDDDDDEQR